MITHLVEQGSSEWFELRKSRLTASHAQAIGSNGKGLETYITELMADYYSIVSETGYTSEDMERGNELEDIARSAYELTTGETVKQVGFIERDEYVGVSPDGLVGEDGGIEIKCLNNRNHFALVMGCPIDTKHVWQMQMCLYITGRKYWDYVCFNPNYAHSLFIQRITPDEEKFKKLEEGFKKGKELIQSIKKKYER